jgi:hypothetical protein
MKSLAMSSRCALESQSSKLEIELEAPGMEDMMVRIKRFEDVSIPAANYIS